MQPAMNVVLATAGQQPATALGPELIIDPFLLRINAWALNASGTMELLTVGAPAGYASMLRGQSGDGTFDRLEPFENIQNLTIGATYRVQALVQPASDSGDAQGFYAFSFTAGAEALPVTGTGWQTLSIDVEATATSGKPRLYVNRAAGNTSDAIACTWFSMRRVL